MEAPPFLRMVSRRPAADGTTWAVRTTLVGIAVARRSSGCRCPQYHRCLTWRMFQRLCLLHPQRGRCRWDRQCPQAVSPTLRHGARCPKVFGLVARSRVGQWKRLLHRRQRPLVQHQVCPRVDPCSTRRAGANPARLSIAQLVVQMDQSAPFATFVVRMRRSCDRSTSPNS